MIHLAGDGIAGRLLARALVEEGVNFRHYGDGETNTPPVAFVHLFQGRTFHRDPVEVAAFRKAVEFWRSQQCAAEWRVMRSVSPGDRLDRSADTQTVPQEFRPKRREECAYEYGPGFTVCVSELLRTVGGSVRDRRVDVTELCGTVVHATGLAIESFLPELRWDTNPGRTVRASATRPADRLYLFKGCHLGSNPGSSSVTIGGRVNSKGEAKGDEIEIASEILQTEVLYESEWWGKRIANALDRWPLIGWLNERHFLFAGFGGRALFWLPYCCELALTALRSGSNEAIPSRLRADRFEGRDGLSE